MTVNSLRHNSIINGSGEKKYVRVCLCLNMIVAGSKIYRWVFLSEVLILYYSGFFPEHQIRIIFLLPE